MSKELEQPLIRRRESELLRVFPIKKEELAFVYFYITQIPLEAGLNQTTSASMSV